MNNRTKVFFLLSMMSVCCMNHVFSMEIENDDAEFAAIANRTIFSLKKAAKKEYKESNDLTKSYKIDNYIVDRNALIDQDYLGKVEPMVNYALIL